MSASSSSSCFSSASRPILFSLSTLPLALLPKQKQQIVFCFLSFDFSFCLIFMDFRLAIAKEAGLILTLPHFCFNLLLFLKRVAILLYISADWTMEAKVR